MSKGWTAPAAGYYLTPAAMRETVAGWQTAKAQAEERADTITQLEQLNAALIAENTRTVSELKAEVAAERRSHNRQLRRKKRSGVVWGIVIGGIAGAVIGHNRK